MAGMSNPAQAVIEKFGGPSKVAELCKCDISRVHRWTYPKDRGGSGGIIPTKQQNVLLSLAHANGVELTRDEFFHPIAKQSSVPHPGVRV